MNLNKLLLNPSKTEFLLIGTKQQRLKFSDLTNLSLSNDIIPVSSSARNLGFIFDSDMSFSDQIKSVSKSCHFHIRDIRRIRHLLPLSAATALANSLVSSKLDYCNSLYSGISQVNLNKLQRIQNSLARVITNTSKYQHITPILKKLHWLPIKQRIDYKLCLLTYKTLTNQQPTYLYNSLSFPSHSVSTRSSDSLVLSIPYVRSSLGKRAFSVIRGRIVKNELGGSATQQELKSWGVGGVTMEWTGELGGWTPQPPRQFEPCLSSVHVSGIHSLLIPETRLLYQYSVPGSKHTSSKLLSLPRLFPISLDCLPGFWFLLFSFYALSNDT